MLSKNSCFFCLLSQECLNQKFLKSLLELAAPIRHELVLCACTPRPSLCFYINGYNVYFYISAFAILFLADTCTVHIIGDPANYYKVQVSASLHLFNSFFFQICRLVWRGQHCSTVLLSSFFLPLKRNLNFSEYSTN